VFLDRGHPYFRNFNSTIPIDVIRVKSYVNNFLDPMCVPVRISINKLDLIPDRIVAGLVGVLRNGGGLGTGESYIPVVFFDPLLHRYYISSLLPLRLILTILVQTIRVTGMSFQKPEHEQALITL